MYGRKGFMTRQIPELLEDQNFIQMIRIPRLY